MISNSMVGMGGGLGGEEFAPGSDLPPGVTPAMAQKKQQSSANPALSWVNSLQESGFDPFTPSADQAQAADQPQAMAPRLSFRERRAARPSFRERRAPMRTQRQAYRQLGGRPMMDWIISGDWGNKADRRSFGKDAFWRLAGIANPALRMPIAAYQTAKSLKGIRSLSPAQRRHVLAMNFMGGPLSKMFGPRASALGGIMALRQGNLPRRDVLANMLVRSAPRGYRDVAGGIAGLVKTKPDSYRQIASNLGRSRVGKYIGGQIARRMWQEGADPRWIQAVVPTMTKTITERIIPEPPGPE